MFQNIVLLLDSSTPTEHTLPLAAHIARGGGGRLLLFCLLPSPTCPDAEKGVGKSTGSGHAQETARAQADMEGRLQQYRRSGVEVTLQLGMGPNAPGLVAAVRTLRADLLILCRAKRAGLARWKDEQDLPFMARHTSSPVLLLPEQAALPTPKKSVRVLVPLDGSRLAETALAPAASLAAALASPEAGALHLVRVISDQAQQRKAAAYLRVVAHRLRRSSLAQAVPSISWSVVCHLDVAEALCWVAEQGEDAERVRSWSAAREISSPFERCDLIALTTHGRCGLERWTLGSVAERLRHWGRRALLILPPPGPTEAAVPTAGEITEAELHAWLGESREGRGSASRDEAGSQC